jgi:formylglycine-generating enzyme required for sulfatase activity
MGRKEFHLSLFGRKQVSKKPEPTASDRTEPSDPPPPPAQFGFTNSLGMEFMLIPTGDFWMGNELKNVDEAHKKYGPIWEDAGFENEFPRHRLSITKPFYLQTTPVTQAQWKAIGEEKGWVDEGDDLPVTQVSWDEAQVFIRMLNECEDGQKYRLPTEAEWEYACRAGTETAYNTGDKITIYQACYGGYDDEKGVYAYDLYDYEQTPVKTFSPNAWGLYDMHGNVWEWCQDVYDAEYYSNSPSHDPQGPDSYTSYEYNAAKEYVPAAEYDRVLHGGSTSCHANYIRSAVRSYEDQNFLSTIGFRIAGDYTPDS